MRQSSLSPTASTSPWNFDSPLWLLLASYIFLALVLHTSAHLAQLKPAIKQACNLLVAFGAMALVSQLSPSTLKKYAWLPYLVTCLLLIAVFLFGHTGKGAQRWLDLKWVRFEPSELMKIVLPLTLASYLDSMHCKICMKTLAGCAVLILIPFLLIAKQPDLGTASLNLMIGTQMLLMAGLRLRVLLGAGLLGLITSPLSWMYLLHDYQKKRILTLLSPNSDISGSGYHIFQAKIAIGSGGFLGKGWHLGTQTHLEYLPEHNTDFVFALCAEEFGFLGCLLLVVMCIAIIARCLFLSLDAKDHFTQLLIASIAFSFGLCSFINMAMVCGLIPVVGVPLPFMSYGGTTLLVSMTGFGLINACLKPKNQPTL